MRSSNGLSPAFRRCLSAALITGCALLAATGRAEMPDYARTALNSFNPEPPPGWSYTLATVRNNETRATARFDAAKSPGNQWTLVELNGRAPTADEAEQYARSRSGDNTPASAQGVFQKRDIDPASVT